MNAYHAKKREEMEARLEDATFLMTDGGCTLEQAAERVGVTAETLRRNLARKKAAAE